MKLNKILMCAVAAGAMAFVSDQAQAGVVISGNLYVPISIKGTFSYVASAGKIKQGSFTSKQILSYLGEYYYTFPAGTMLAVGPSQDVYAITKTAVVADLTVGGFFYFSPSDTIDTEMDQISGAYKYNEAGLVTLDFFSDDGSFAYNEYAFELSGFYTYTETGSAPKNGCYNQSSNFSAKNLSGLGYNYDVSGVELPVTGSGSGSGSGKLVW